MKIHAGLLLGVKVLSRQISGTQNIPIEQAQGCLMVALERKAVRQEIECAIKERLAMIRPACPCNCDTCVAGSDITPCMDATRKGVLTGNLRREIEQA